MMAAIWFSHYHVIPDNFGTDEDINTYEVSKYITIDEFEILWIYSYYDTET